MSTKVYIDGSFVDKEDAKISVYDHGLLYGDGVFEGLRSYSGKVFKLEEHIDRLWESASVICLTIPYSKQEIIAAVNEAIKINDVPDGYVRLVVTRGAGYLGLDPSKTSNPQVIIIADTINLYPEEFYKNGLKIVTVPTIRNHPAALSPRIKSLNYLNNVLAKIECVQAGASEALMLNHKGEVAECSGDNIFIVRRGELLTPPIDAGILEGVTRDIVIELAREENLVVRENPITRHDVYIAEECFLTGTAAEVVPVADVDGRTIGSGKPGPITLSMMERYHALVHAG
jgi:branched-chain amino acid aminotransferase